MKTAYASLEFSGLRKGLFYFMTGLSALIVLGVIGAIGLELARAGHITRDNLLFQLSATDGTIIDQCVGQRPYGPLSGFLVGLVSVTWLLSSLSYLAAFFCWLEMAQQTGSVRRTYASFLITLGLALLGILSWPAEGEALMYLFSAALVGATVYICLPVVRELKSTLS